MDPETEVTSSEPSPASELKRKCFELPILESYQFPAPSSFWQHFPISPLLSAPTTPVKVGKLTLIVEALGHKLTSRQQAKADLLKKELSEGALVPKLRQLPSLIGKHSPSTVRHGKIFTDTIACWVKKGYVSGPFILPPFPDFRSNSMLAVEQPAKIRAVMDLSSPEGESFNDAIHEDAL
jgi:hypothetical protein